MDIVLLYSLFPISFSTLTRNSYVVIGIKLVIEIEFEVDVVIYASNQVSKNYKINASYDSL